MLYWFSICDVLFDGSGITQPTKIYILKLTLCIVCTIFRKDGFSTNYFVHSDFLFSVSYSRTIYSIVHFINSKLDSISKSSIQIFCENYGLDIGKGRRLKTENYRIKIYSEIFHSKPTDTNNIVSAVLAFQHGLITVKNIYYISRHTFRRQWTN